MKRFSSRQIQYIVLGAICLVFGFGVFHARTSVSTEYRCKESELSSGSTKSGAPRSLMPPSVPGTSPYTSPNESFTMLSISIFYVDFARSDELDNLKHFCLFGVHVDNPRVDYEIILTAPDHIYKDELNQTRILDAAVPPFVRNARNVRLRWRPNEGSDFCTLTNMLKDDSFSSVVYKRKGDGTSPYYTHFWLMNGTVRGPYLPIWAWRVDIPWWDTFLATMEAGADGYAVDVVSSFASCENQHLHCQSMALLMTRRAFDIAAETFYCQRPGQPRHLWIHDTEVKFSKTIVSRGLTAKTLLGIWNGKDLAYLSQLTEQQRSAKFACLGGNPLVNGYAGTYPNPLETVFYKWSSGMHDLVPKSMQSFMASHERMQFDAVQSRRPEIRWNKS
eukprot:TRINITY_DN8105_c0_g1_i1.p2 TRINITY_DN8105_c0_g1~~TRINITY_DN8105_c0_g1_i1.p2  ORF type:complete len:390 (+),score=33.83 TRINITY_DN8105_c0_g1_i1:80-1249(+)